ncbi:MAG TPA: sulfite exporter TauE/SafE family protein [Selenomonadales bacterium]|nr:sulfite exporter TauE/SafE family protein [Selenomonadales bacterium]
MVAVTLAVGLMAGVLSGLFGIGGGVVLVPALVLVLGIPQHAAQGISMVVIIPTALTAIWQFHKDKLVDYRMAAYLGAGAVLGALVSANFVQNIPAAELKRLFGGFVILIGLRMIYVRTKR